MIGNVGELILVKVLKLAEYVIRLKMIIGIMLKWKIIIHLN